MSTMRCNLRKTLWTDLEKSYKVLILSLKMTHFSQLAHNNPTFMQTETNGAEFRGPQAESYKYKFFENIF